MRTLLTVVLTLVTLLLLVLLYGLFAPAHPVPRLVSVAYSDFVNDVKSNRVTEVSIQGSVLTAVVTEGRQYQTYLPADPALIERLLSHDVRIRASPEQEPASALQYLLTWFPTLILFGVLIWIGRSVVRATKAMTEAIRVLAGVPKATVIDAERPQDASR